jgi:hypothetical protein
LLFLLLLFCCCSVDDSRDNDSRDDDRGGDFLVDVSAVVPVDRGRGDDRGGDFMVVGDFVVALVALLGGEISGWERLLPMVSFVVLPRHLYNRKKNTRAATRNSGNMKNKF